MLALALLARPGATGVAVDFSPTMLQRLADDPRVAILSHDLSLPLPPSLTGFDAVDSAFAIHHLDHPRKRALYEEIYHRLTPGGLFANLEHVASPTASLHARFYEAIGSSVADEDASNQLLDVKTQLQWLRDLGYEDVDCYWKWRELALLIGRRAS